MSFPLVFEIIRSIYKRRYNAFIGYSVKARAAKPQIDPLAVVLASVSYALRYSKICVKIKIIYAFAAQIAFSFLAHAVPSFRFFSVGGGGQPPPLVLIAVFPSFSVVGLVDAVTSRKSL